MVVACLSIIIRPVLNVHFMVGHLMGTAIALIYHTIVLKVSSCLDHASSEIELTSSEIKLKSSKVKLTSSKIKLTSSEIKLISSEIKLKSSKTKHFLSKLEIPKGTSIKSYLVNEVNGFIYVWYHANGKI